MYYQKSYCMLPRMTYLYLLCLVAFVHLAFYHFLLGRSVFLEDHFERGKTKTANNMQNNRHVNHELHLKRDILKFDNSFSRFPMKILFMLLTKTLGTRWQIFN